MKILEVPAPITLRMGEDSAGKFAKEFEYPFAEWLREAICAPASGFGAWDKHEVGLEVLRKIRAAKKSAATEIELENEEYNALFAAVKAFQMNPEAAIQVADSGYRKAIENPKKGKGSE